MKVKQLLKNKFSGFDIFEELGGSYTVLDRSNIVRYSISGIRDMKHLEDTVSSLVEYIKESEKMRKNIEEKIRGYLEEVARYNLVSIKEIDESRF
jgi:hypothetical protein